MGFWEIAGIIALGIILLYLLIWLVLISLGVKLWNRAAKFHDECFEEGFDSRIDRAFDEYSDRAKARAKGRRAKSETEKVIEDIMRRLKEEGKL